MKKGYLLFLLIGTLMLTGCGTGSTKTLSCTLENEEDGILSKNQVDIVYDNDEVKTSEMEIILEAKTEEAEAVLGYTDGLYTAAYEGVEGVVVTEGVEGNTYTLNLKIDFKKASKQELKEKNVNFNFDTTMEELKKEAEEDGYTCTIK